MTAPAVLTVEQLERLLSLRRSVEEEVSVSRYAAAQDYDQALNDHADALLETAHAYHRLTSALEFISTLYQEPNPKPPTRYMANYGLLSPRLVLERAEMLGWKDPQ